MANGGIKTPLEVKQGGWTFSDVNQHRGDLSGGHTSGQQRRWNHKAGWWRRRDHSGGWVGWLRVVAWTKIDGRWGAEHLQQRKWAGLLQQQTVLKSQRRCCWAPRFFFEELEEVSSVAGDSLCSRSASSWLQAQPAHTGHKWRRDLRTWHPGGTASPRTTLSSRVLMTGQVLMESGSYSGVSHGLSLAVLFKKETTNWHHLKFSLSAWIIAVASSCSKMCGSGEPQISETNSRAKDRRLLKLIKSKTSIIKTGKTNSEIQSKLLTLEFPEISQGQHAENIRYTREVWCTRGHKETEATRGNKISGNWRVLRYSWI